MIFKIQYDSKKLTFDSNTRGLIVNGIEYRSGEDGILVYDKVLGLNSNEVTCQLSTNTSTLIPGLKIAGLKYNSYFDIRDVIESQNDITFYWKASRLAAFYNRYSTDGVVMDHRESIVRSAVSFLIDSSNLNENFLPEEKLKQLNEKCRLLGFYEGFPIFDASFGLPQLQSRIGIHIGIESISVSTPVDKYQDDVYKLAEKIESVTKVKGFKKKNRVRFENNPKILRLLSLENKI